MNLQDVMNIEGEAESADDYYISIQRAINSLSAWSMQGSMGRAMMEALLSGQCMLGLKPTADYYGHRIPSRFEIEPGRMGSRQFVIDRAGEEWADQLEEI